MTATALGTALGMLFSLALVVVTIWRQRRFEIVDLGYFVTAFLAATNIPPAILLCVYGIEPDPSEIPTKLHGLEKYVSYAGVSLLLVSLISLWALYVRAFTRADEPSSTTSTIAKAKAVSGS